MAELCVREAWRKRQRKTGVQQQDAVPAHGFMYSSFETMSTVEI
jgi:hypothetical protein